MEDVRGGGRGGSPNWGRESGFVSPSSESTSHSRPLLIRKKCQAVAEDGTGMELTAAAFSPSNMTPRTLNRFDTDNIGGVPLQTSWTFWIDKYVCRSLFTAKFEKYHITEL